MSCYALKFCNGMTKNTYELI